MRSKCPKDNQCNDGTCLLLHTDLVTRNTTVCSLDSECRNENCELSHTGNINIRRMSEGHYQIQRYKNLKFNSYEDADQWLKIHENTLQERV